jgi:hypothetical protein
VGGECGTVSGRGGDAGVACARGGGSNYVWLALSRGRRKLGGAHVAVIGEGGGGLGRPEAKNRWGGRLAAGLGRRRRPNRGGGGVGLEGGRG